jgi:sugar lactone lactonase YvrE
MKRPSHTAHAAIVALLLAACGDDGDATASTETSGETSTDTSSTTAPGSSSDDGSITTSDGSSSEVESSDASGDSSGDTTTTGGGVLELEVVAAFDPAAFELPEGLVIDGGDAIVGFAFTGAIERVALADGARTPLAVTPPPPPNTSFVTGLGLGGDGAIHAAVVSFTAELAPGIYRAPADGGDAELWASDPAMVFPNGLAWADDGALYVTDSAYGGVFVVDAAGVVAPWVQDPLLAGDATSCGAMGAVAVGANGLVWTDGALIVSGGDQGVLLRIPIADDGNAGTPETIAGPDCELAGIDGIALDDDGSIVAAINRSNRLVRIDDAGAIEVLAEGPPLDFPATVAFAGEGEDRSLVVTNFALAEFSAMGTPTPALLKASWP